MRLIRALPLLALASLVACGEPPRDNAANDVADGPVVEEIGPVRNALDEDLPRAEAPPEGLAASDTFDRLGRIRIGATPADLGREGVAVAWHDDPMEGSTYTYATFQGLPDVSVMLDGERIVRIDVSGPQHATLGGVKVGMAESEAIRRLGRVDVRPHPYTGPQGHYLLIHEEGAPRGLILETDGKTVQTYRFGQWEQVQWIEGCA